MNVGCVVLKDNINGDFMKTISILAFLFLGINSAEARLNTRDMECQEAQDILKSNGTLILSHGNPLLYSKFVANQNACAIDQKARTAFTISLDKTKCKMGYVCGSKEDSSWYIAPSQIHICKEGKTQVMTEYDSSNDRSRQIIKVCREGKWINLR
ncbi:MAG: hypothetical protein COW78_10430 [Bdellovibrio sp. CG22_combo_CG10-13_8_21_14_all_39_27]|nr:MAG: hypothetical protein COW78_10430 [Bdellovibrio sp. CG22_combo_CG10-13_8_21_14_all_39_27]